MENNVLLKEIKGNVGTLTINRPEKRNSLTADLLFDLIKTLEEWAEAGEVRVVVLTGTGDKAFSGGFDVRSIPTQNTPETAEVFRNQNPVERSLDAVKEYPYPTIAMINGYVLGAAFNLTMCCDIRIAADHVRMGIPPAKLGLVYPPGGLKQIVEAIGMARAREVFFTGRLYDPEDVLRMSLVHQMVPRSELESATYAIAEEIAENAPLSLKGIKKILNMLGKSLEFSDEDWKEAVKLSTMSFLTEDAKEGQLAFIEKRKPMFKGR
jgi:enoyl-CoA hydratase/carnithine racemase